MPETEPTVVVERDGAVAVITLNRPDRHNGVTVEMCRQLYSAVRNVAAGDARVLLLRGAGTDFCVGADIGGGEPGGTPPRAEELGSIHHISTVLHTMPQVTIAAIDGGCAGAGLGWAAACDFRFASDMARFNTAFLDVGVPGDMGLAWSLTRIVGGARARELLFFPARFDAARALEWGLVTRVIPRAAMWNEIYALAHQLAEREPFALKMMKANMLSAEELAIGEFIDIETARHLHATSHPDIGARMEDAWRRAKGD